MVRLRVDSWLGGLAGTLAGVACAADERGAIGGCACEMQSHQCDGVGKSRAACRGTYCVRRECCRPRHLPPMHATHAPSLLTLQVPGPPHQNHQLSALIEHSLEKARARSGGLQRRKEQDAGLVAAQLRCRQLHELQEGGQQEEQEGGQTPA